MRAAERRQWAKKIKTEVAKEQMQFSSDYAAHLIETYINMVIKHGVGSQEAKAFRFGTDSDFVERVTDEASIEEFNSKADLIDRICLALKKGRR